MKRLLLIFGLILIAAIVIYFVSSNEEQGIEVEVSQAELKPIFRSFVTGSGEIVAARYADIGSSVMGKIVDLPVREGQAIKEGQLLARIDPVQAAAEYEAAEKQVITLQAEVEVTQRQIASLRSQLDRARAVAQEAELTLTRVKQLFEKGVVAAAELDQAQAAYQAAQADVSASEAEIKRAEQSILASQRRVEQSKAQVTRARDIYSKTEILSPISGIVSRLLVREGEMVVVGIQNAPGTTLMTISDLSNINAEVKIAEADILRVEIGQDTEVLLDALADRRFSGKVIEVGTSALTSIGTGSAAREFKVVIRLDEPDPGLRPGLTCDAEILTDLLENAVTVPLQSVVLRELEGNEKTGVFLAQDGFARFQPVRTGVIGGLDIEVEGISADDPVIAGPFQVLREIQDGTKIKILN
jgi:HlyD family secretion protein